MRVPICGHIRLHFGKDPIGFFFPLLQKGFQIEIESDNLNHLLSERCGLGPEEVKGRIQTLFLNGKPVDDFTTTHVQDGDCLALSAAMPGLVGATMRSGGVLAGFRRSISHCEKAPQSAPREGLLSVKLFNLLIKEMGPRFLRKGILVDVGELGILFNTISDLDWKSCRRAALNSQKIDADSLAKMQWSKEDGFIRLEVTFGEP
jgi:hypothetical protein